MKQKNLNSREYRYPGTQPFDSTQQNIFYGRSKDIEKLYNIIRLENLIVLYSKSGLGKSSLINAGIIPKILEENSFVPIPIRFGTYLKEQLRSPLTVTSQHLSLPKIESIYLNKLIERDNSLWSHIKCRQFYGNKKKGFLLVFDQFEELFTYPTNDIFCFVEELLEILNNQIPQRFREKLEGQYTSNNLKLSLEELDFLHQKVEVKILLAIRSDRMSLLNNLKNYLPNILRHCYELDALSVEQAEDAIISPALKKENNFISSSFYYDDDSLDAILEFLTKNHTQKIEAFQLQILCQNIENKVIHKGIQKLTLTDIGDIENIYNNHYESLIKNIGTEKEQIAVRKLIEEGLIFEEDERRITLYEGQILKNYDINHKLLYKILNTHLIRSESSRLGGYIYEISHDTLIRPILKAKSNRIEIQNQKKRIEEVKSLKAKEKKAREQAKEERLFREQAEARETYARKQSHIAKFFSILTLFLFLLAIFYYGRAKTNATIATNNAKAAKLLNDSLNIKQLETERLQFFSEKKAIESNENAKKAKENEDVAQQALKSLKNTHVQLIETFINLSDKEVLKLNYQAALIFLRKSSLLVEKNTELSRRYMEMSFIYNETGKHKIALNLLDTASMLYPNQPINSSSNKLSFKGDNLRYSINNKLKKLDQTWFKKLNKRYYPEMLNIIGGDFCYGLLNANIVDCDNQGGKLLTVNNYKIARTETTVWQFNLYILSNNLKLKPAPSWGWQGNHPIVNVSWYETIAYCSWLNKQKNKQQTYSLNIPIHNPNLLENNKDLDWENIIKWEIKGFRLPSDVEWEFAAKEGSFDSKPFSGGTDSRKVAWLINNSEGHTKPVGLLKSNKYGLKDMSGNVSELSWNWIDSKFKDKEQKTKSPNKGEYSIIRGGSWKNGSKEGNVLNKDRTTPKSHRDYIGFRVVISSH